MKVEEFPLPFFITAGEGFFFYYKNKVTISCPRTEFSFKPTKIT